MAARLVHVGVAAAALYVTSAALRTVHAEIAYDAGLRVATEGKTGPAADLPGRLELYEEALRRDPDEATYALRAAQIRLFRAAPRGGPADVAALGPARDLLDRAAELLPLDSKIHATRAQLERAARNRNAAEREAWVAIATAPRAPGALSVAVSVGLAGWRESGDPSALRLALTGARGLGRIDESNRTPVLDTAFRDAGPELAADLVEATSGDPELRAYAAGRVRAVRPAAADALSETSAAGGR
jgi:hypothetical protein